MHRGYLLQQLMEKNYTNALPQLETHSKLEMLNLLKTQLYCFWTSPFPSAMELYEGLSKVMHTA